MKKRNINKEFDCSDLVSRSNCQLMDQGCEDNGTDFGAQVDVRIDQVSSSWKSADKSAESVWGEVCSDVLYNSTVLFAYRSTCPGSSLLQLIVARGNKLDDFKVGITYASYSIYLPSVKKDYLLNDLRSDLVEFNPGDDVIKTYDYLIGNA